MTGPQIKIKKSDFDQIKEIITSRTGLVFQKSREAELRQRLSEGFRESGCSCMAEYIQRMESGPLGGNSMKKLIARLTVGETYFFRNKPQFEALRNTIIPNILRRKGRTTRTIRIWSAGCSTGEEAYSLAILLYETVPNISKWSVLILGTDISEESLQQGEAGEYREWSFREVDPAVKGRYFTKIDDVYKIHPDIRKMVTFRYLNLIEDIYPLASNNTNYMDMIMCRNVMIYFNSSLNRSITRRFFRSLNNEGYLFVGHSEHPEDIFGGFGKVVMPHAVIYVKKTEPTVWEHALRLRFRGSGSLPANVVPVAERAKIDKPKVAAAPKPRTRVKKETVIFEEGAYAYKNGKTATAIASFKKVLEINPGNNRACYMLALIEADRAHFKKAKEYARMAIKAQPLYLEAHYLMAVVAREEGDRENEHEYLKKVIYIDGNFILGHYQMGIYYNNEGNFILARKFFRNCLKLLDKWEENDYIEESEGMTVGRLRSSIFKYMEDIDKGTQPALGQ